jgi:hypothetical protein
MEQGPSWESNRLSASQEIPRILWNSNGHNPIIYGITDRRFAVAQIICVVTGGG